MKSSPEALAIVEKLKSGKSKPEPVEVETDDEGETEEGDAGSESAKANFETLFKLFRGRECTDDECSEGIEAFRSLKENC